MFMNLRREAYFLKVKLRQMSKLDRVCHKNRGGRSNNQDGRHSRDRIASVITSENNNKKGTDGDGTIPNIKDRWVVNLSGQPLTDAEYRVLAHG